MIKFINSTLGTARKFTCVSRPRRFGKSFAAKMLCAYYDKSCNSRELFEGLDIAKEDSFEKYLNKYDVIYLDITLFISKTPDIRDVVQNINDAVVEEVGQMYPGIKRDHALADILFHVTEETGNRFIVIIDEWDALFREAKDDTKIQKEYIDLLRSLFKSSWTDTIFEAAYMTGILPIKKYGNHSAVSDFREYTMLSPGNLAKYIGFTELEVRDLCEKYGAFGSYWARTETYESLKIYIDLNEDGLKEAIVQMHGGERVTVDVGTLQNDMTNIKRRDDVLTLLIHLGYLAYDTEKKETLIPNEEVKQEFIRAITASKHTEIAKLIDNSDNLIKQTLNMNEKSSCGSHRRGA